MAQNFPAPESFFRAIADRLRGDHKQADQGKFPRAPVNKTSAEELSK